MTLRDPNDWMWERAAELLERADRVQRHFFQLAPGHARASWEPPVDVFETDGKLAILVALPGVEPANCEVGFERGEIVVRAHRNLPAGLESSAMRRVEIPQGRFERRIALPAGRYELAKRELEHGVLVLEIRKVTT